MTIDLITAAVFIGVWTAAYHLFIRPLLLKYAVTAGVVTRLEAAEGNVWKKLGIWFEGKKTLLVAFVMSLFASAKGATTGALVSGKAALGTTVATVSGLSPADLAPFQDKTLWSAFFGDVVSFHILAALSLLAAFLTLRGKVTAAAIVPAPGTAIVTPATPAQP